MNEALPIIMQVVMYSPIVVLCLFYFILKKMKLKQRYAVGFSADITTLLLILAVPYIVQTMWNVNIYIIIIIIAIVLGLILTFIEWRTKKEIEIPTLMRKIWRVYFVMLMITYIIVGVTAIIIIVVQNI